MNYNYLILGNGVAGLTAAENIRKNDSESTIAIFSAENVNTYYRMRLTGLIAEDFKTDNILVKKEDFYKENNIDVYLGEKAVKIETDEKIIKFEDSKEVSYDKLLIATGSSSFVPPIKGADLEGVFTLRSVEDLENIKEKLENSNKVVVIGGGLLGIEAAWSLRLLGKDVHVIDRGDRVLSMQLDTETSEILNERLKKEGITVHLNASTKEIKETEKNLEIDLGDSTLDADMILMSTGVKSNIQIAEGTDLETNRGIVVDSQLKTNIKDIYAAGDIAEVSGRTVGLWTGALEMGKIAGQNMTGNDLEYKIPKLFASLLIGDIKVFSAGNVSDDLEVLSSKEGDSIKKLFVDNGKLVGSVLYGDIGLSNILRTAVFENPDINEFLKENNLEEIFK